MASPAFANRSEDDYSDSDAHFAEPDEDRLSLKKAKHALGVFINYVEGWESADAFREFYQNWKDGIIASARLGRRNIKVSVTDKNGVYVVTALHPDSEKILGFIRFREKRGDVELTNFDACLSRKCLSLGKTSKRGKDEYAGTHGEGFKIASLVMVRQGYQVRYEASSFYWTMRFGATDEDHLSCYLNPISFHKIQALKAKVSKSSDQERELVARPYEDTTVKIGNVYGTGKGKKVTKPMFMEWTRIALDLRRPEKLVETQFGVLLLDKAFKGEIYLKGLLLNSGSYSGRRLKFGYNFRNGSVNRDRERVSNDQEEAGILAGIWEESATKDPTNNIIKEYVDMLVDGNRAWGDVNLFEKRVRASFTKLIWQELLRRISDSKTFYYDQEGNGEEADFIRKSLKMQAEPLPGKLWKLLSKHKLMRTSRDQRIHLLQNATIANDPGTKYSMGVTRALKAALSLDPETQCLEILFKSRTKTDLDLLLKDGQIHINEKWLDFEASHAKTPCWLSQKYKEHKVDTNLFTCDHVVSELYSLILMEAIQGSHNGISEEKVSLLMRRVSDSLRQMPRKIEAFQADEACEIEVLWTDPESEQAFKMHGVDMKCRVTLHRESTCQAQRLELIAPDGVPEDEVKLSEAECSFFSECGCPERVVLQRESRRVFKALDPNESYFPMIARIQPQAFFGIPTDPVQPTALENSSSALGKSVPTSGVLSSLPFNPKATVEDDNSDMNKSGCEAGLNDGDSTSQKEKFFQQPSQASPASNRFFMAPDIDLHELPAAISKNQTPRTLRSGASLIETSLDARLRQDLVSKDERIRELEAQNEALNKEIRQKHHELQDNEATYLALRTQLNVEQEQLREARADLDEQLCKLTMPQLAAQAAALYFADDSDRAYSQQPEGHYAEAESQHKVIADLEGELLSKDTQITTITAALEALQEQVRASKEEISKLKAKHGRLLEENSTLVAEVNDAKDNLAFVLKKAVQLDKARTEPRIKRELSEANDNGNGESTSKRQRLKNHTTPASDSVVDLTD